MSATLQVYCIGMFDEYENLWHEHGFWAAESREEALRLWNPGGNPLLEADGGEYTITRKAEFDRFLASQAKPGWISVSPDQCRLAGWHFDDDRECQCCGEWIAGDSNDDRVCPECNLCRSCAAQENAGKFPCSKCSKETSDA